MKNKSGKSVYFEKRGEILYLFGKELFGGSMQELLNSIRIMCNDNETRIIVTPNVDQVINLGIDSDYREAFRRSAITPIDGYPITLVGRLLTGKPIKRNTGADLLREVCADAQFDGIRIALVGGPYDSSQIAASKLEAMGICKVLAIETPFKDVNDPAHRSVISELHEFRPNIVFVGMGSPRQESWLLHWERYLPPATYIGSGAAYAFMSGDLKRAPRYIQKLGLEWLYRVCNEPRRLFYRYFIKGPRFAGIVLRSLRHHYKTDQPSDSIEILSSAIKPWGAEHSLKILLENQQTKTSNSIVVRCISVDVAAYFREIPGVKIDLVKSKGNRLLDNLRLLQRSRSKTTVIFSLSLLPLVPLLRLLRRKVIIDLHDYPQELHVRLLVRIASEFSHKTIAISRYTARLSSPRVTSIVRRPFEQSEFIIGNKSSVLRVGVVGRLDRDKGLHLAIEAFHHLDEPSILKFVGAPTPGNERYVSELLSRAGKLKHRFEYVGAVDPEKVFQNVDVLLVTNSREAAGRTVVEAMIAGIPVVVPDEGGAIEYVVSDERGWIYPADDALGLAKVLKELIALDRTEIECRVKQAKKFTYTLAPETTSKEYFEAIESS